MYGHRSGPSFGLGLLTLCVVASASQADETGAVTGKVTLKGGRQAATPRQAIQMGAQPDCVAVHGNKPVGTETEMVSKDGMIANVLVYVKAGLGERKFQPPAEPVKLDQKGCMYTPHVLGLMVGQKLEIGNSDPMQHNVNAKPEKNDPFNKPQPSGGVPIVQQFKRPEIFRVKCDVHPWMDAWCGVFAHPFFAVSAKDGTWTLKDLPPGEYTIEAWHEVYGTKESKVTIKTGEAATLDFELESAAPKDDRK